jgi:uncharacterized membrane protein SirB2
MLLALTSVGGFTLRWAWMKSDSPLLHHKLTRILPHIIDSLFLAAGIWLAISIRQYPFTHGWLTAKVLGLVTYIILGSLALKHTRGNPGRNLAFLMALLVFAWVVSVARSKNAWGFVAFLF